MVRVIFGGYGMAAVIASAGNQAQSWVNNGHGKNNLRSGVFLFLFFEREKVK